MYQPPAGGRSRVIVNAAVGLFASVWVRSVVNATDPIHPWLVTVTDPLWVLITAGGPGFGASGATNAV
jgi:hypothetical protein